MKGTKYRGTGTVHRTLLADEVVTPRRALGILERQQDDGSPVLANDIPRRAYLSLLRVKQATDISDQPGNALAALEEADRALPEPGDAPGASSQALAQLAGRVADILIFPSRYYQAPDSPEALRATRAAVRHNPQSSRAW
jgi:hypothetical protein